MINNGGMKKMPVANSKGVGPQGVGGANLVKGPDVAYTHNPRGIVPKKIGGGIDLVQGPKQPKVGK